MGDNVIKLRRLGRGWSQEQLAEMCGLSVRTIQRIENGDQASLETMSAIAAVFGCDVAQLRATASAEAETTVRKEMLTALGFKRIIEERIEAPLMYMLLFETTSPTEPDITSVQSAGM